MSEALTVELKNPEPDTLEEVASTVLFDDHGIALLSLRQIELQDEEQRGGNDREDNGKGSVGPSPTGVSVELIRYLWSSKGSDDIWGRGEGVRKGSVLQLGDISGDDVHTELHTTETKVVEHLLGLVVDLAGRLSMSYISGTVDSETVATGHKDETDGRAEGHEEETFRTAPGVHHLGHGQEDCSREGIGNSRWKTGKRMLLERTGDIRAQTGIYR